MIKEVDEKRLKMFGKLTDNEDDLSKIVFIKKDKTKLILKKFAIRRD
jgi:hypothetical protein